MGPGGDEGESQGKISGCGTDFQDSEAVGATRVLVQGGVPNEVQCVRGSPVAAIHDIRCIAEYYSTGSRKPLLNTLEGARKLGYQLRTWRPYIGELVFHLRNRVQQRAEPLPTSWKKSSEKGVRQSSDQKVGLSF
jgi:hypothetical protein